MLSYQEIVAGVATRPEAWRRQLENQAIRANVEYWRHDYQECDRLGLPLTPAADRAQLMQQALVECVERTDLRAS